MKSDNKKILVILADYKPFITSNAVCIEPYLKAIEQSGFKVDILTRKVDDASLQIENESEMRTVFRVDDKRLILSNRLKNAEVSRRGFAKIVRKMISFVARAILYTFYSFGNFETYSSGWNKKEIEKVFKELSDQYNYTYVMSISFPEKTQEFAKLYITKYDKSTKWLLMEYDPFFYNKNYKGRVSKSKLFKIQMLNYSLCYKILVTPQLLSFYNATPFSKYANKMIKLEYANFRKMYIQKENVNKIELDPDRIKGFFCGIIRKDIRPITKLLSIMEYLPEDIKIYIMTGSKLKPWHKEIKKMKSKINIINHQNKDTANYIMIKSDFLINIGNSVQYQIPGKLFEYMSVGKPIVHISSMKNDPCISYFKDYPLSLVINYDDDDLDAALKINKFIRKCKQYHYSFDDIRNYMDQLKLENTVEPVMKELFL